MSKYIDSWDKLANDELVELSQDEIDQNNNEILKKIDEAAKNKKVKVLQFIASNPNRSLKDIVDMFDLDWSLIKAFGNGIGRVAFYTDESQRHEIMNLRLPVTEWFR